MQNTRQIQDELRRERDFFETVFNTVDAIVLVLDRNGYIIRFNRTCEKLTGYLFEEVQDRPIWEILIPKEHMAGVKHVFNNLKAGMFPNRHVNPWIAKDGHYIYIDWSNTALLDEEGNVEYVVPTGIDVTEKQKVAQNLAESREFFKTLVEFTDAIHFELDLSTRDFTYVSPQIEKILGYPPSHWGNYDAWVSTIYPDDAQEAIQYCSVQIAEARDHAFKYRAIAADGTVVWLYDIVKVIQAEGTPQKLIGLMMDISESQEQQGELLKSLEEKNILLAEVHHRVKNNMAIISSFLELQANVLRDPVISLILKESRQRIKAMALVHEKLYKSGDFKEIDLHEYLMELVEDLMDSYDGSRKIGLSFDISQGSMDLNLLIPLGLIVNELTTNALKYAFKSIETPELSLSFSVDSEHQAKLVFSDNGIGLPEDEELSRYNTLGLNVTNALVGQLGGQMTISREGGTTFTISFPIVDDNV